MLPDFFSETYKHFERISKICLRFIDWKDSAKYNGCNWIFEDNDKLNDNDRKWLSEYDESVFKTTGSHLIYNYDKIRN